MCLCDRVRQELPARTGYRGFQGADDDAADTAAAERARQAHDGDDRLHEDQRGRIGQ